MGDSQSEDEEPFSLRSYVQVGKVTAQREFTFVCSVRFRTFHSLKTPALISFTYPVNFCEIGGRLNYH